jgi:Replication protein
MAEAEPPLGNNTDSSSTAGQDRCERRASRLKLRREWHKRIVGKNRLKACGQPGRREDGSVTVKVSVASGERSAGIGGLYSCGSGWTCPVCSHTIAVQRAKELNEVLAHYVAAGGTVALVTLTMRHNRSMALADSYAGVMRAWSKVTSGGAWQADRKALGLVGVVRATEITDSFANGWHPHIHAVLVFEDRVSAEMIDLVADSMFDRWSASLVSSGFPAPLRDQHGLDVRHMRDMGKSPAESMEALAKYVTKGLAFEATMGNATKVAKEGSRSMMQLLEDAVLPSPLVTPHGEIEVETDQSALARWWEYVKATKGKRQLEGLTKLRKKAGMATKEDQEILDDDQGGETVAVIPRSEWSKIAGCYEELLATIERDGVAAGFAWLRSRRVQWHAPTVGNDHAQMYVMARNP